MIKASASIQNIPYKTVIKSPSDNTIIADEPLDKGGADAGLSPKELLAASLSACTAITLRMYIQRKGWEIQDIKVETEIIEEGAKTRFNRNIEFGSSLDEEKRSRLLHIANACPVHKILSSPIDMNTAIL
jgi:putative redox protein